MAICLCCRDGAHGSGFQAGRRGLLGMAAGAALLGAAPRRGFAADPVKQTVTPDEALQRMKDGNEKFQLEAPFLVEQGRQRRIELARGQSPFCILVGCSDSRVPPELLFGRGLGELFIVRNAGNTVDTAALGSVEYGVGVLGVPLIVVLSHESCGAVSAAVDVVKNNATFPGVIGEMIQPIIPAVLAVRDQPGDMLDNAVRSNARRVAARLKSQSPVIQSALAAGKLKVVASYYALKEGHVTWMEDV